MAIGSISALRQSKTAEAQQAILRKRALESEEQNLKLITPDDDDAAVFHRSPAVKADSPLTYSRPRPVAIASAPQELPISLATIDTPNPALIKAGPPIAEEGPPATPENADEVSKDTEKAGERADEREELETRTEIAVA